MHESPLAAAVLEAVLVRAADRPVAAIAVAVGVSHRALDDAFEHLFRHVAEGTVAEGASVRLRQVPFRFGCAGCGAEGELDDALPLCPSCDEPVRVRGGDELAVESITFRAR